MSAGQSSADAQPLCGFINIDKPPGITAHDVVARVRRLAGIKQVGHGGTLDPMATGVLPVAIGKATRLLRFLNSDKTYLADIRLGLSTTTDDVEGETLAVSDSLPDLPEIERTLYSFQGELKQKPPIYSAVHVNGKRLYQLAREGKAPDMVPTRDVRIYDIQLLSYQEPVLKARIFCSAGTYIRSIARDLGDSLGCGGCLQGLIREQAGPFVLAQAVTLDELAAHSKNNPRTIAELVIPPEAAIELDSYNVSIDQARQLSQGRTVTLPAAAQNSLLPQHVLALCEGKLLAVCSRTPESNNGFVRIHPEVVLGNLNENN
jgi:tRNA pseudouridine55 synthase